jgi:lysozyme
MLAAMATQNERPTRASPRSYWLGAAVAAGLAVAGLSALVVSALRANAPHTPQDLAPPTSARLPPAIPSISTSAQATPEQSPSGRVAIPPAALPDCQDLGPSEPRVPLPDLPRTERARGVDASSPAPWKTLRDAGFVFAFAQAAYGIGANPSFAANWAMMRRCGLYRAAYHFITPMHDGAGQARVSWGQISGDPGELPPIVDVEKPVECRDECCDLKCEPWILTLRAWIDEMKRAGGREPLIYTVEPFWNQCLCGTKKFGAHSLWLAGYPKFNFPEKLSSGGWTRWTFYQHAGNVRVAAGVVDLNLFQGTSAELDQWVKTGQPP